MAVFNFRLKLNVAKQNSRARKTILKLCNNLNNVKNEMKKVTEDNLNNLLENSKIPTNQTELIKEMFASAKCKNPKNRRYNENWMLSCLLFQIR